MQPIVLVIEDEEQIREGICNFLNNKGYKTIKAKSANQALPYIDKASIILLDIMLPDTLGTAFLKKIREISNVPVIMLTALIDEDTQITSFNNLADDYITKPFSLVILEKHIKALLRRQQKVEKWIYGNIEIDFSNYKSKVNNQEIDLKPKEIDLLNLFINNPNRILTRNEIMDYLYQDEMPFDRIIDTYIKNIRKKLPINIIKTIRGIGYSYEEPKDLS